MKVLLIGWFGEKNIGDDLILQSSYQIINEKLNPDKIYISSNHRVDENYNWVYDHDFSFKSWIKLLIRGNIIKSIDAWIKSDIVIFAAGGGVSDWNKVVLKRLIQKIRFFKFLNKKIIFLAVGAGPFVGNYSKQILLKEFSKIDIILARDITSYNNLQELGLENVVLTNDIVFENKNLLSLKNEVNSKMKIQQVKEKVCIIPTPIFYNELWESNKLRLSKYIYSLEKIISFLEEKYEVVIIPFQKEFDKKYLLDNIDKKYTYKVMDYNSYEDVYLEIATSKFTIPMRFHGLVLSTIFEIPMIPIIYDHKLSDLCKDINVDQIALSAGDGVNWIDHVFSFDEFKESYNYLINNYDLIKSNCENYNERTNMNGFFLEGFFET